MEPSSSPKNLRKRIFFVVVNVISFACLAWTLYRVNFSEFWQELAHVHWRWVALAVVIDVLVYACQAWRWMLVLKPVKSIPMWDLVRSVYVGLFYSEVFPLRPGEIIRCYLLGRFADIPVSVSLASALIERIFDGIWLVVCLFVTAHYVHLPKEFVASGYVLIAVIVVCGALLALTMFWKQQTLDYILGAKWLASVHVLIEDLHLIGHSRYLYYAAMVSLGYILIQVLPIYAIFRSYPDLNLSIFAAFALMVMLRVGSVPPQAPGNVGIYQYITSFVLTRIFLVDRGMAANFSQFLFTVTFVPLLLTGFIAVAITGVKMSQLHKDAQDHIRRKDPRLDETPVS